MTQFGFQKQHRKHKQKAINKNSGVVAGLPDYYFVINGYSFWIEMKREFAGWEGRVVNPFYEGWEKSKGLSSSQVHCITKLNNAVDVFICYGFNAAKKVIDTFLKRKTVRYLNEKGVNINEQ